MKKKIAIVITIIGVILLTTSIIVLLTNGNKNNSGEKKEEKKKEEAREEVKLGKYTGVYKLEKAVLKVIHAKNTIFYKYENRYDANSHAFIEGYFSANDTEFKDGNMTIKFEDNKAVVTGSGKEVTSGDYPKSEYSLDDIYEDQIGRLIYEDSKYNGIYKSNDKTIYIYKKDDNEIRFVSGDESIDLTAKKLSDKTKDAFKEEFFDTTYLFEFSDNQTKQKRTSWRDR